MNHVYKYDEHCFSAKNKKEALEYYIYETGDDEAKARDFSRENDNSILYIMFREKENREIDVGDIIIPERSIKSYLGEDDGYEDFTWEVCARNIEWAKSNEGFLCKTLF